MGLKEQILKEMEVLRRVVKQNRLKKIDLEKTLHYD
jgi:hypothetical protein